MSEPCEIHICPIEAGSTRFGGTDWESRFEIWNVNSERDSVECWRNGELYDGSIGSRTSKETQRCTKNKIKVETKTSESRRRRIAQMLERSQSLLQYYSNIANCMIGILRTMDPTLHYKMMVTSRWWIWRRSCRLGDRHLSVLIVNIETDAQAECNQGTVDKFGRFSRWTDHDSNEQSKGNEQSKSKARATSNAKFREDWLIALLGE